MSERATILVVCTGNVCRSALAHMMLRRGLDAAPWGADIVVASAGTRARDGMHVPQELARLAHEHGIGAPETHASRRLETRDVRGADLVLVATREHRADVVQRLPRASRKTFTIREFARLIPVVAENADTAQCPQPGPERLRWLAAQAARYRGYQYLEDPSLDDLVDPYGQPEAVYCQMDE